MNLLAARGGAADALGYAAGGEESPVINTTEEEQVETAIIKGALQMDKEKENTQRGREPVYDSPFGTLAPSSTLVPPLITWESDEEPSMKVPGLATRTDPMSDLKSMTGGTETLYLNLTPLEAGEVSNETEGPGVSTNHSQAAAVLAELEKLQQEANLGKDVGIIPPKLDFTVELEEKNESSERQSNPNQPLKTEAAKVAVSQASDTDLNTANVRVQEAALTAIPADPSTIGLMADGGAKPKALGNPLTPVRVQLPFDFYLPGGKKASESITYQINDFVVLPQVHGRP